MVGKIRGAFRSEGRVIERRDGEDRRRALRLRQRLFVALIVGCFAALVVGNVFAWTTANTAGNVAELADREAQAALAGIAEERRRSCQADEIDREREREIGRRFPQAGLPPVPAARDCQAEADEIEEALRVLFEIAASEPR